MPPPIAKRILCSRTLHGDTLTDEYAWLRDRSDPDVLAYLEAENAFTEQSTAHLAPLRRHIFEEIRSRVNETDLSAPSRKGDWWYATRTEQGRQYPWFVRMKGAPDSPEQVLLDVDRLAEGKQYLRVGVFAVSPDQQMAAYSTDVDGGELFTMRFRHFDRGDDLADAIPDTYYTAAWSTDSGYLFYTTVDGAHRPHRVWRHRVGMAAADDSLVIEETDERFFLSVGTSQDDRYLLISAQSQITADVRYLEAADAEGEFRWVLPRVEGIEYSVDHRDGRWLVVTNHEAINGRLISLPVDAGGSADADGIVEIIPHDPTRKVEQVLALSGHTVVTGRSEGLTSVTIATAKPYDLSFDEPVFTVAPTGNLEYDAQVLRLAYQSLTTPRRVIDHDLVTGERTLVKETLVPGGYEPTDYASSREWAIAGDGARIPVSIVRRVGSRLPAPLLLYGYGAYEASSDPWFSPARLSLLDRGVVFAIAHIRGGGEQGRRWYEEGKLTDKKNTFADFIACAEHLISGGWTSADRLAARGGSAGGLLMGAVANLRPDLFSAIVAEVPFVDVINTMLDETIPLTVIEWEEWGNPQSPDQYRSMLAYSPYDNVAPAVEYPAMLVTAGLNDPRVAYWEPAKWVAKLRAVARHRGPLLLKTELGAGHGGRSGRYDAWHDEAFVLSFLLDRWGLS